MNILFVVTNLNIGGAEVQVVNLSNSLISEKHNVTVCTLGKGGVLKDRLNSEISYYELGEGSNITIRKLVSLNRVIKQSNIQVIHSHLFKGDLMNYMTSLNREASPIRVSTEHSSSSRRKKYKVFGLLQNIMYRRFHAITTISEDVRTHTLNWSGVNKDKLVTIHNGTDMEIRSSKEIVDKVQNKSSGRFVIGSIARLETRKDLETALKAIHYLVYTLKVTYIEYIIYGDGPEKEKLQHLVKQLSINKYVVFAGFHSNIKEVIDNIDLHILTSKEEGFGISIIETMARGIPNIATRTGGIPEILTDNIEGFLVECGDYQEIANKINILMNDSGKLIEFGIASKERVEKKFTFSDTVSNILVLYNKIFTKNDIS
ncbi:glycosyl transferase [Sporosarcina luteola]|uniref:Glycosyl transferase n=1 Tax=Sporosarcina luteola TaxID=582850 RepID=A0A511Z2Z4_9BACL|nr:glycosyltransferase [Sporosarcina luteola]GEN81815.1 glycosyl transferase [Sporosarcina luteola]